MFKNLNQEQKTRWLLALSTLFISLITYIITMQKSVPLWDCGEFAACASVGGIPHPPGTPFFMILGRFFTIIFEFLGNVATRINLLAALSSAFGVMIVFLFTEKVLYLFLGSKKFFYTCIGGLVAAFLVTFSDTYWFNAVESEVYASAMMISLLVTFLSLKWYENKNNTSANWYLILIVYLSFLGIGFNQLSVITLPAFALFMLWTEPKIRNNWVLMISGFIALSVIYSITKFLPYTFILIGIWVALYLFTQNELLKKRLTLCICLLLVAILGFSTHAYIPIRSALNPYIDENNPEIENVFKAASWTAFNDYISRKQYGSRGAVERALSRRGQLANQFLAHPHMGYGGYMFAQYLPWKVGSGVSTAKEKIYKSPLTFTVREQDPITLLGYSFPSQMQFMTPYTSGRYLQFLIFILFHIFILWGVYQIYKKQKYLALYIFSLYFLCSIGLIFYYNFGDGTLPEIDSYERWVSAGRDINNPPQPARMEVRERDYFFVPGYVFMGVLLGISAALYALKIKETYKGTLEKAERKSKMIAVALVLLAFSIPCASNFQKHNRHFNYVAYNYAKNLLASCLPNSILITNGDNDTFPLWYLQAAESYRRDVRIVNLSLTNTKWFARQFLTKEPKLKLSFDLNSLERLGPQTNPFTEPRAMQMKKSNIKIPLPTNKEKPYFLNQDILLLNIVQNNFPERPVHAAATVGKHNLMGLPLYMKHDGMVLTLTQEVQNLRIDVERTTYLIDSVYDYGNLGTKDFYLNNDNKITIYSYLSGFQNLVSATSQKIKTMQSLQQQKESKINMDSLAKEIQASKDFAIKYINKGSQIFPFWHYFLGMSYYYDEMGDLDNKIKLLEFAQTKTRNNDRVLLELARAYEAKESYNKSLQTLLLYKKKYSNSPQMNQVNQQIKTLENKIAS